MFIACQVTFSFQDHDARFFEVFGPFGAVTNVTVCKDEFGGCTGTAYVKFGLAEDALTAIQTLCGNPLPDGSIMGVYVKKDSGTSGLSVKMG